MLIKILKLRNYRKFANESIEFPDGVIGIVGNNGAGKSTIIEAMGWALYGQYAARTEKDLIKREGSKEADGCSVELEFVLDGQNYLIRRELRGRNLTASAAVYVDGKEDPEARTMNGVTKYIEKKLGMDYRSFFTSIFAKQKELNALSDLKPEERKKQILRMLSIDRVDIALAQVRKDAGNKKDRIEIVRITLKDLAELKETLSNFKEKHREALQLVKKLEKEKKEISEELSSVKNRRDTLEEKNRTYQTLHSRLKVSENEKESTKDQIDDNGKELNDLLKSKEDLDKLEPKDEEYKNVKQRKEGLDELRERYLEKNGLEKSTKELENENKGYAAELKRIAKDLDALKNLDKKFKTLKSENIRLEQERDKIKGSITTKKKELRDNKNNIRELKKELEKINKLGPDSKCPTCGRLLGKYSKEISAHFKQEIKEITGKVESATQDYRKLSRTLQALETKLSLNDSQRGALERQFRSRAKKEENVEGHKRNIKKNKIELQKLLRKLHKIGEVPYSAKEHKLVKKEYAKLYKIREKIIGLRKEVSRIPSVEKKIRELGSKLVILKQSVGTLNKKMTSLAFDEAEYTKVKSAYESVSGKYHLKDKELINEKNEALSIKKDVLLKKDEIEGEKKKRESIEKEEKEVQNLSKLEQVMKDFRIYLISRIRPMLSYRSAELFKKLTDGKYANIELDENYEIHIQDEGKLFKLSRFSGGEEDLANLCLRIAISQVIAERSGGMNINFIALDEIFGSQDSIRKNNILEALNELSSQFRQIILITHVEDVKDSMPYTLNVSEGENGISHISVEGSPKIVY